MPSKQRVIVWGLIALLAGWLSAAESRELQRKKLEFLKTIYRVYGFSESPDWQQAPQTLEKYFTAALYRRLRGNDLVGFQYDEGFTWSGDAIWPLECKTTAATAKFASPWRASLEGAAHDLHLAFSERASCQLGACLVAVVENRTPQSLPGVVCELYAKNIKTGRNLYLRLKSGSREGWLPAMRDAWRYAGLLMLANKNNAGATE